MSLTDEGNTPSNKQTASDTVERAQSGQNGVKQGLPGLAGFGQTPGYAPVTAQPQEPLASEETETDVNLEYPDTFEEPEFTNTFEELDSPDEAEYPDTLAPPEFTESPAAPVDQPETAAPVNLLEEIDPQAEGFLDDQQGLSHEQEPQFDNPPDFLAPESSGQLADESYTSDDLQSFMSEPQPEDAEAMGHSAAGGFDTGLGINPDEALHAETGNNLQTFEAHYDQHPEIPLGAFDEPAEGQGEQPFFHEPEQEGDAEFLTGEPGTEIDEPNERKGRKILMAASGLIGIMALGGALAFAYKIGGDSDIASTGKPPLIQADSRPVKVAPAKPGGKQFPHKNKKIYERLQGEKSQVVERLVPRQESVAAAATAALGTAQTAVANTVKSAPPAPVADAPAGAPRKVKTLTVRPDGTIEPATPRQKVVKAPPPAPENAGAGIAMSFPQSASTPPAPPVQAAAPAMPKPLDVTPPPAPAQSAPLRTAALPRVPASAPPPVQKPRAPAPQQQTAARPAPAVSNRSYVVQVAARKSQTDALAAFADIQQKYPKLLSGYRPIIKKADLGSKGVWYRLNVGPVKNKKVASNLCSSLKGAGMRSCIIRAQ
jgi:hypothetical protein